jgi:hypothetical protein
MLLLDQLMGLEALQSNGLSPIDRQLNRVLDTRRVS